jgi:hypothetical protein
MKPIPTNKASAENYFSWCFSFKNLITPIIVSFIVGIISQGEILGSQKHPTPGGTTLLWYDRMLSARCTSWYEYLAGGSHVTVMLAQVGGEGYSHALFFFSLLTICIHSTISCNIFVNDSFFLGCSAGEFAAVI